MQSPGLSAWTAALLLTLAPPGVMPAPGVPTPTSGSYPSTGPDNGAKHLYVPEEIRNPPWVGQRQSDQFAAAADLAVVHDFRFYDRQRESGISFTHQFVADAGIHYKAVHYDHGNGIAAADVDGDGRTDLYLVSQAGPNALYRNLGGGRFEDITTAASVGLEDTIGAAASFADIDNDGDADLYVTQVRAPNRLFENLGDGRFRDVSNDSGIDFSGHSSAAVFFDYDRDGLLDLFLAVIGVYTTNERAPVSGSGSAMGAGYYVGFRDAFAGHLKPERLRPSRIFRNLGGNRFEDVTERLGLVDTSWTGAATPVDFNGDGWQDLYLLNMQGHDQYWENQAGRRFVQRSQALFPKTPWGSMGVKSLDMDNDGDMDLLVTDMHSDMSEKIGVDREKLKATWIERNWSPRFLRSEGRSLYGNALFRNTGKATFEEVSDDFNFENYWPWGLSAGDLNADGWQDLFITASMNYPFRYSPNSLLLNNHGRRFYDAEYLLGVEPRRDARTSKPWFQLDCSGAHQQRLECRDRAGMLTVEGALGSRSSVLADFDGDGDLDVITLEFGDKPQVLFSNLAERRGERLNYLKIGLKGQASNRDGLGARVTLITPTGRQTQVHDGLSGYLGQSSLPLYFGLNDDNSVSAVEVQWPSGRNSRHHPQKPLNRMLVLSEPAD